MTPTSADSLHRTCPHPGCGWTGRTMTDDPIWPKVLDEATGEMRAMVEYCPACGRDGRRVVLNVVEIETMPQPEDTLNVTRIRGGGEQDQPSAADMIRTSSNVGPGGAVVIPHASTGYVGVVTARREASAQLGNRSEGAGESEPQQEEPGLPSECLEGIRSRIEGGRMDDLDASDLLSEVDRLNREFDTLSRRFVEMSKGFFGAQDAARQLTARNESLSAEVERLTALVERLQAEGQEIARQRDDANRERDGALGREKGLQNILSVTRDSRDAERKAKSQAQARAEAAALSLSELLKSLNEGSLAAVADWIERIAVEKGDKPESGRFTVAAEVRRMGRAIEGARVERRILGLDRVPIVQRVEADGRSTGGSDPAPGHSTPNPDPDPADSPPPLGSRTEPTTADEPTDEPGDDPTPDEFAYAVDAVRAPLAGEPGSDWPDADPVPGSGCWATHFRLTYSANTADLRPAKPLMTLAEMVLPAIAPGNPPGIAPDASGGAGAGNPVGGLDDRSGGTPEASGGRAVGPDDLAASPGLAAPLSAGLAEVSWEDRGFWNTPSESPRFVHDCPRCTFLGRFRHSHERQAAKDYDLYHCGQAGTYPTIIARYGDDGPDYTSGIVAARAFGDRTPLGEALRRAEARGLPVGGPMTEPKAADGGSSDSDSAAGAASTGRPDQLTEPEPFAVEAADSEAESTDPAPMTYRLRLGMSCSFTFEKLTFYRPPDGSWSAREQFESAVDRIVREEVGKALAESLAAKAK